jgi:ketosteroid isomerase-like protein
MSQTDGQPELAPGRRGLRQGSPAVHRGLERRRPRPHAATYTDDVIYRDPRIRGLLHGNGELRRYLSKFFAVWDVRFTVTDERRIVGENAQLCMWDCEFTHRTTGRSVTLAGMDLCEVRGGQLSRDEAFMDTLPLEGIK